MDADVMEVRDRQWAALIQDRMRSGLTVEEWCRQQNIGKYAYYYHLRKLRRQAIVDLHSPDQKDDQSLLPVQGTPPAAGFVAIPNTLNNDRTCTSDDTALRVTKNDLVIEVSNNASEGILSLLREVLMHAS